MPQQVYCRDCCAPDSSKGLPRHPRYLLLLPWLEVLSHFPALLTSFFRPLPDLEPRRRKHLHSPSQRVLIERPEGEIVGEEE